MQKDCCFGGQLLYPDGKPCTRKATKELGYFLVVNALKSIGEGRDSTLEMYCFLLFFSCITFKLFQGDILEGFVHKVMKHGVFLSCGPVKNISLIWKCQITGMWLGSTLSSWMTSCQRLKKMLWSVSLWLERSSSEVEREFQALVSLEGDYLGPIS